MKDKTYRYSGPNSAVTLVVPDAKGTPVERGVMLWAGRDVVLPEGHEYTQALLKQGLIAPVATEREPLASVPAPIALPAAKKTAAPAPATVPAATH